MYGLKYFFLYFFVGFFVFQTPKVKIKNIQTEKITLQKLDPKDLANLIQVLNLDQFTRFKR